MRLRQILLQIGKNFNGHFSDVATGLWRELFEPHAMSRVVPAFQIGQNVHRRRPSTSVDDDHVQKVLAVIRQNRRLTVREVAEEVGICKSACHSILTEKTEHASCCRKICATSVDASLLTHQLLTKHETTVVPQPLCSPDLAPADFFLFPDWKSSLKDSRFQTVGEIEESSSRDLRAVPQNTVQDAFQK